LQFIFIKLKEITVLNNSTAKNFTDVINNADIILNTSSIANISEETKKIYREIIRHIEYLIKSVNSTLNITDKAVALVSNTKNNSIYHFNQFILLNSSIIYSSDPEHNQSMASISINETYINQLSNDSFYSFFFLPSSFFQYAQIDPSIEVVSPIVGAHLPNKLNLSVEMSFRDDELNRTDGNYSCAFWQDDGWNKTGCNHLINPTINRHSCYCNHLTSFALIFTPNGILRQTFLPTIITSCLSIIGLCISIILSVYQQIKPQSTHTSHRLPIINMLSILSILILFVLMTTLLIINYQTSGTQSSTITQCQSSKFNLVLATYFFIMLTFITKTLLGMHYFFTIFDRLKLQLLSNRSDKWFFASLITTIILALIPTIIAIALSHRWDNVIVSSNNVCWFHGIYLINFVIIPVSIFVGINTIIVILISIRLCKFLCYPRVEQARENRLLIATCFWVASCVLLGIVWILGPLLNLFVNENGQSISTASQVMQWIFALLIGLEGVWVLIVNILFYIRQRSQMTYSLHSKRKWYRTDSLGNITAEMHGNQD
jgi:hypothetical protein